MYMMLKSIFTAVAMVFVAIVLSQVLFVNMLLGFLLFMAIVLMIMGDMVIGIKISDFKVLFEPTPRGKELMELQLLDGRTHFINTTKGPHGKRSFRINREDASIINDGKSNFTLVNNNRCFRAIESYDGNVDPFRAKALELMEGANVKEIYRLAKERK